MRKAILAAMAMCCIVLFCSSCSTTGIPSRDTINSYSNRMKMAKAHFRNGLTYLNTKLYDLSINEFDKVIELKPYDSEAFYYKGKALSKKGLYKEAIKNYNRSIEQSPSHFKAYIARSAAFEKMGNHDAAVSDAKKVYKWLPDDPSTKKRLRELGITDDNLASDDQLSSIAKETAPKKTSWTASETESHIGRGQTNIKHASLRRTRWALIIGISDYQDSRIPSLRYASSDAQSFYDWIVSPRGGRYAPAMTKLLLNQDATGVNIRKALFQWLGQALEEDIITIYFAGHGSPQSPENPDNLFLLPYNTKYDSVAATGFPMWDIETALKRFIKSKKVIVIADACHAGGVGQSFDVARRASRGIHVVPISSKLQDLTKIGDGICIISASDDSQYSQESKRWGGGHGVFTYYLLRGIKGEADYSKDNRVSLGEIIPYLSEQVRRATRNAQTPTVAGRFDPALTIGK